MTVARIRRLSLWIVLLLAVAVTAYGLQHEKLFAQGIWSPIGLRRLLVFAACYALCVAVFLAWKPSLFPGAVLAALLVYSLVAVGPVPLLSVALVLLSSTVLGNRLLLGVGGVENRSLPDALLGMLLGLSVYMLALSIAAQARVNYPLVYLAALAIPLVWDLRATLGWLARIRFLFKPAPLSRTELFAAAALIFVLLVHCLVALEPETGPDALAMHLVVSSTMASSHTWTFDVKTHIWAVMPMGADWCFTLAYLLGGEAAARLLNLSFFLCIATLLLSSIRKWLPPAPTLLAVALFAATPLVQLVTGGLFAENLWALLCFGALISLARYREREEAAYLNLAFVLLGAAAATKFGALAFVPPFGLISLWTLWKRRRKSPAAVAGRACVAAACFLLFAAPPYLTAYAKTGSPVFPFLATILPSRYPNLTASATGPASRAPLSLETPYDLTFHTSWFREVQDGAAGFQYLLFLPLGVLLLRRNWPDAGLLSGFTLLLFGALTLRVEPGVRYLYPALPLATVFIASAFAAMRGVYGRLYQVVVALAAAVLCLDLYFLPSSGWTHKDFVSNPASSRARSEYVTAYAPERNLVAYLNQADPGLPAVFFESNAIAGLRGVALTASWHAPELYNRVVAAHSPLDCFRILEDYGVHLVVAPSPGSGVPITTTPIEAFLKYCTEPEERSGNFYAGRLKDTCSSGWDEPGSPAPSGEYDDFDARILYRGVWARGRFAEASHGTLTYSNARGAALVFPFEGAEVLYGYTKAFNRGIAEIILDGASQGSLDQYSPTVEWQSSLSIRATGRGPHTLEIRVTGRKDQAASDAFIDVDELIVR